MVKKKRLVIISAILIIASIGAYLIFIHNSSENEYLLTGRWIRTDSDYQIQILEVIADGRLKAQYFNPNPINVAKAEWSTKNGSLKIIIELRDVNYPGSTYTLNYLPDRDILAGEYYQAVEGLTFYVEFSRIK